MQNTKLEQEGWMQTDKYIQGNTIASQTLVRPALHQELVEKLRDMIVDGSLAGGEHIDERHLCESFGVSRTPFREALMVLAAEGLVELIPRRGARVMALAPEQIRELLEVLGGLEALAGELACARASAEEIATIETKHAAMRARYDAGDMLTYFKINESIHDAIVAAAHNTTLAAQHRRLRARVLHELFLPNIRSARWSAALDADSDEVSHRFRPKPATCSEASQPGIPMEASRGGGAV
jgi:DNA-binding GntR family transcriptional regulator